MISIYRTSEGNQTYLCEMQTEIYYVHANHSSEVEGFTPVEMLGVTEYNYNGINQKHGGVQVQDYWWHGSHCYSIV